MDPSTSPTTTRGRTSSRVGHRRGTDDVALRDLQLASEELGVTMAAREPRGDVAAAIAAWIGAVGSRLGRDLVGLPADPVLLARGHAVVGGALLSASPPMDAPGLAAQARDLTDRLRRSHGGGRP